MTDLTAQLGDPHPIVLSHFDAALESRGAVATAALPATVRVLLETAAEIGEVLTVPLLDEGTRRHIYSASMSMAGRWPSPVASLGPRVIRLVRDRPAAVFGAAGGAAVTVAAVVGVAVLRGRAHAGGAAAA